MGGVYSTRPVIQFLRPGAGALQPDNGLQDDDVIGFALTVAQSVNNGHPVEQYASPNAPLYGAGLRQQVRIGVPNTAGQWGTSYGRAEIAISIVGTSRTWVEQTQSALIARVVDSARANQEAVRTPPEQWMKTNVQPASTTIEHVVSSTSSRAFALAALMAAATLVGGWCCVMVDRVAPVGRRLWPRRAGVQGNPEGKDA